MLMTSSVTSCSRKNQQVACIPDARGSDVVEEIQSQATVQSADVIWRLAIAKRCRLHKLIRQRFALAIKIQQEDFALFISADEDTVSSRNANTSSRKKIQAKLLDNQTQATAASSRELI
ncbi:putative dimethyladenosine transferase [Dorcoceras hygrometricum]|uniref:Putative dimethyladenosine transferase n=1 Tax=Dorcoceras hygrometricum TaxID=472368 RepID=A0A2Z7A450_9LAMI|nr:putative dimethyladenosine transferase [Dorcoceras hygrometricum]